MRVSLGWQIHQRNASYISQNISLETSNRILSNGIIFRLYNSSYVGQIIDLGMHASLINRKRGSIDKRGRNLHC